MMLLINLLHVFPMLVLTVLSLLGSVVSQQVVLSSNSNPLDDVFEDLVNETMSYWHVPGMSIAVIDGNETWAEGYGIATFPHTPAEASTLWLVGSTTKAFTAAAMSTLVDDDEKHPHVRWDTPISALIRDDFVLENDYATTHITVEDALSHRSGLPRHDLSYGGPVGHRWTPKEAVRHLRYLPITAEPRTKWQYCNLMFVVVAHVIETLTGSALQNVIRTRILKPLGMESTYFSTEDARKAPENFAQGYDYYDGKYHEVADFWLPEVSGAGFIVSNVLDYSKWARSMMDASGPLSKKAYTELWTPRMLIDPSTEPTPYTGPRSYALGWETGVYNDHQFFQHGGGMEAYGASFILFPALRYGVVAFGNTAGTSNWAEEIVLSYLVDNKLGVPKEKRFDFNKMHQKAQEKHEESLKNAKHNLYPNSPTPPLPLSLPLSAYTGTYHNPGYQNYNFFLSADSETLQANRSDVTWKMAIELEHVSGEFFIGRADSLVAPHGIHRAVSTVEFRIDADGKVLSVGAALEPMMKGEKIWFERIR